MLWERRPSALQVTVGVNNERSRTAVTIGVVLFTMFSVRSGADWHQHEACPSKQPIFKIRRTCLFESVADWRPAASGQHQSGACEVLMGPPQAVNWPKQQAPLPSRQGSAAIHRHRGTLLHRHGWAAVRREGQATGNVGDGCRSEPAWGEATDLAGDHLTPGRTRFTRVQKPHLTNRSSGCVKFVGQLVVS